LRENTQTGGCLAIGPALSNVAEPIFHLTAFQDDVERLIHIAAKLFTAIERQIQAIERDLLSTLDEDHWFVGRTVFKEQLIRSSLELDSSLQQIANHLGPAQTRKIEENREAVRSSSTSTH
jgi:hypothetical protein